MKCVLLSLLVLLSPVAGLAQPMQVVRATRLAQNPLITVDTSVSLGGNVNGQTVIRVPDWVGRPLGRYYMYFANHKGEFIRLAYADAVTGPWKVFEPGVLHVRDTAFFRPQPDPKETLQEFYTHVASPEIVIEQARKRFVMWYHGYWTNGERWPRGRHGRRHGVGTVMSDDRIARRTFLERAGLATLGAGLSARSRHAHAQTAVPNSVGTESPRLKAPANACDCHHHIYDAARFPPVQVGGTFQPNARVEEYRLLQRRIGTARNVIVTPAPYIGDNRVTLDAIAKLGAKARGVALLRPDVTAAELKSLTDGGIRGLRFSQDPRSATTTFDMIEPLSKRVAAFGWHVQIFMPADRIAAAEDLWNRFPTALASIIWVICRNLQA